MTIWKKTLLVMARGWMTAKGAIVVVPVPTLALFLSYNTQLTVTVASFGLSAPTFVRNVPVCPREPLDFI